MHNKDLLAKPMPVEGNKLLSRTQQRLNIHIKSGPEFQSLWTGTNKTHFNKLWNLKTKESNICKMRRASLQTEKCPAFFPWLKECINTKFVPGQPFVSSSSCTINKTERKTHSIGSCCWTTMLLMLNSLQTITITGLQRKTCNMTTENEGKPLTVLSKSDAFHAQLEKTELCYSNTRDKHKLLTKCTAGCISIHSAWSLAEGGSDVVVVVVGGDMAYQ